MTAGYAEVINGHYKNASSYLTRLEKCYDYESTMFNSNEWLFHAVKKDHIEIEEQEKFERKIAIEESINNDETVIMDGNIKEVEGVMPHLERKEILDRLSTLKEEEYPQIAFEVNENKKFTIYTGTINHSSEKYIDYICHKLDTQFAYNKQIGRTEKLYDKLYYTKYDKQDEYKKSAIAILDYFDMEYNKLTKNILFDEDVSESELKNIREEYL